MGFFDFLKDMNNYEQRKVDRYEDVEAQIIVDTCATSDGTLIFETAMKHPKYDDGDWIVVEAYETKEEAQLGHDRWVSIMTSEHLPNALADCGNSELRQLLFLLPYLLDHPEVFEQE